MPREELDQTTVDRRSAPFTDEFRPRLFLLTKGRHTPADSVLGFTTLPELQEERGPKRDENGVGRDTVDIHARFSELPDEEDETDDGGADQRTVVETQEGKVQADRFTEVATDLPNGTRQERV